MPPSPLSDPTLLTVIVLGIAIIIYYRLDPGFKKIRHKQVAYLADGSKALGIALIAAALGKWLLHDLLYQTHIIVAGVALLILGMIFTTRSAKMEEEQTQKTSPLTDGIYLNPHLDPNRPSAMLDARNGVVPFYREGRKALLEELEAWRSTDRPVAVRLIHGLGGMGKTRLLAQWCEEVRGHNWQAGFLPEGKEEEWRKTLGEEETPVVAVIDYAESRKALLPLLEALAYRSVEKESARHPKIRLVLLARNADEWWRQLTNRHAPLSTLLDATPPHRLEPFGPTDRAALFQQAGHAYALRMENKPLPPAPADLEEEPLYDQPLYILMAAYAALSGQSSLAAAQLIGWVLDHEEHHWHRNGADLDGEADFRHQMAATLTALTLFGGTTSREETDELAKTALGKEPLPGVTPQLRRLYPGGPETDADALRPDLLGEGLVKRRLAADPEGKLIRRIMEEASSPQRQTALEVLGRIGDHRDDPAARWIDALLKTAPSVEEAYRAAMAVTEKKGYSPLADRLQAHLEALDPEQALSWATILREKGLPGASVSFSSLGRWTYQTLAAASLGEEEEAQNRKAGYLNDQSLYLAQEGKREEALRVTEEAAGIRRKLANRRPDAFLPDLAMSLNNLGNRLNALGRREEALAAVEEAVEIYRGLAKQRPDAFLPDLAMSLNNLGNRLNALGRREEALAAAEEAVEIRRELAKQRPDAFLPDLATSLNNLGGSLDALGRREKALAAAEEAVAIRRELAKQRPDAFLPNLAMSLNNLGSFLDALGRREEALAAAEEAVEIYRGLANQRPDAFLPDLAMSLNNLGKFLDALGRREEALAAAEEAVEIYRGLAKQRPDAFLPYLAGSLNNLGKFLDALGRREEALVAAEEAVAIRRELAKQRPDAFLPNLAMSLNNLGNFLDALGRREEALAAAEEAVEAIWPFFRRYPQAYAHYARGMVGNLFIYYRALEREPGREAVERAAEMKEILGEEG